MLDVGGGTGIYADELARRGHSVTVVEPVSRHVDEARALAGSPPRFEVVEGDARTLPVDDEAFDAVLLLGPLYHLGERADRVRALAESRRVCRDEGIVVAAAISRFAPLLDMVRRGRLSEAAAAANVLDEVAGGRRVAPERRHSPFPDAYFHLPEELEAEAAEAGLEPGGVFGVQGAGWIVGDDPLGKQVDDPEALARLLAAARSIERMLPAISAHLLLAARRPATVAAGPA